MPSAPLRAPRVCVSCRVLLLDRELCRCGSEGVAPASPVGWDALMAATFPVVPPSRPLPPRRSWLRRLTSPASERGGGVSARAPSAAEEPVIVGAPWRPPRAAPREGVLLTPRPLRAPFSGRACAAWSIWIVHRDQVLLSDARVAAGALQLAEAEPILVEAGRAEILAPRDAVASFSMRVADEHLVERRVHPPPALGDADPRAAAHPFAGTAGLELALEVGARVGLASEVGTLADDEAPASYRDVARTKRAALGAPVFVIADEPVPARSVPASSVPASSVPASSVTAGASR